MTFMVNGNGAGHTLSRALDEAYWDALEKGTPQRVTGFHGITLVTVTVVGDDVSYALSEKCVEWIRHANPTGEVCTVEHCTTDHRGEAVTE